MDLEKANRAIKNAWQLCILLAIFGLLSFFLAGHFTNYDLKGCLIVIPILLGLALGIYNKSLTCAILLFIIIIADRTLQVLNSPQAVNWFILISTIYYSFRGILGAQFYYTTVTKLKSELEKAEYNIKKAWISGIVFGLIIIIVFILCSIWKGIDFFVIISLAYGVYRKNRICALLMFMFYFINLISYIDDLVVIIVNSCYIPFAIQGIQGTFSYHKIRRV